MVHVDRRYSGYAFVIFSQVGSHDFLLKSQRVHMEEQVVVCTRFMISFNGSSCRCCVSLTILCIIFSAGAYLVFSFHLPLNITYMWCMMKRGVPLYYTHLAIAFDLSTV